jgi:hypothetical protein
MSGQHPEPVLPPPDDERMWALVYNALFFLGKDRELEWLRSVREVVEEAERDRRAAR